MESKIQKCGDKLVMVLPDECVAKLAWGVGDILALTAENGTLAILRTQSAHDHAMGFARRAMDEYRPVFEALAKS